MGRAYVGLLEYEQATREFLTALAAPSTASPRLVGYELERIATDELASETVLTVLDDWARQEGLADEQVLAAARAFIAAGRADRGLSVLRRLEADAGLAVLQMAGEQEALGEPELAADLYEAALERELPPEQRGVAALRLAQMRLAQGRWQQALDLLANNEAPPGEQTEGALLRAEILLRFVRDVGGASEAYERLRLAEPEGSPLAWRIRWGLAGCMFAAGDWDRAEQDYRALAEASGDQGLLSPWPPPPPGYPAAIVPGYLHAVLPSEDDRRSAAYAALRLAEISLRRGNLDEAAAALKRVAREHPASSYTNDALARLALIKENFDGKGEAEGEYLRALGLLDRGRWEQAEALLERISRETAEPLADDAVMLLAQSWADRGEPARAVETYERLADESPDSLLAPTALLNAAHLLLERLSRVAEGRALLSRIVGSYPESAAADEARDLLELVGAASCAPPGTPLAAFRGCQGWSCPNAREAA